MSSEKKVIRSLGSLSSQSYGARFYKVDFHFHTPASEDARGKNRYKFNPYKTKYPKKKGDLREYYKKVKDIQEEILVKSREIADGMVKRFREEHLSLVAISDHNSIGTIWSDPEAENMMDLKAPTWYELIDDAAEKANRAVGKRVLTILPGVEISCTGIHILGVFPRQYQDARYTLLSASYLMRSVLLSKNGGKTRKLVREVSSMPLT